MAMVFILQKALVYFFGGGIVVVVDDSTQRLRGNLCNEAAILIYSSVNWTSISKFWFNVLTQFNSIQRFAVFLISCPKSGIFGVFLNLSCMDVKSSRKQIPLNRHDLNV